MKIRFQRRVKGGRKALPACVIKEIYREVEKLAREYRVSKSFVIATLLAEKLGIRIQEKYYVERD